MPDSLKGSPGSDLVGSTAPWKSCQEEPFSGGARTGDADLFVLKRPWLGCPLTNKNHILLWLVLLLDLSLIHI